MTFKKVTIFRNFGLGLVFLLGIVSCEKDLEEIAVDLTGQRPFETGDTIFDIITYHVNVDSSRADNNDASKTPLYLLGVNHDIKFGSLTGDLVTQVALPFLGVDFGDNAIIDEVILDIPYFSTRDGLQNAVDPITGDPIIEEDGDTIKVPNFYLDSIYGNQEVAYQISVHELGTYLNRLDPDDPTQPAEYYSDKEFQRLDELHNGDFKPNRNDTVYYVERRYLDGDPTTVNDIDTIQRDDGRPTMKFQLDETFFKDRFVDHDDWTDFVSDDDFYRYFRGLYVKAQGMDGSLMNLRLSDFTMTIFYTNEVIEDEEEGEDLNYNGVTGESDVLVKKKQSMIFTAGDVSTGVYERDYGGSLVQNLLMNPDTENGEQKLYVQGAAGSEVILELFDQETLNELRELEFLVNEANLVFYLDGSSQDEIPEQLFLYNYDYGSLLPDFYSFRFGEDAFGGILEYDDDGNPEKYKFRITNYINDLFKADLDKPLSKLALKNYVLTDEKNQAIFDTLKQDWNWIPKGVVLHGNRPVSNDKRVKLEIFFSN